MWRALLSLEGECAKSWLLQGLSLNVVWQKVVIVFWQTVAGKPGQIQSH